MSKVSVSIDEDDLLWLRARAGRAHGGNLSAAVAEGLRLARHREALTALLDTLGAPELTQSELETVTAELDGRVVTSRPKRSRRA